MRIGNYTLLIEGGVERNTKVVKVPSGSFTFTVVSHVKRCDAVVELNGEEFGRFRLEAGEGLILPREGRITVGEDGTDLSVRFLPEYVMRSNGATVLVAHAPGKEVRGLAGEEIKPIDHDPRGETVIAVRLETSSVPQVQAS